MIKTQTQTVDLDQIIALAVQSMQMPPGLSVVSHEALIDTVERKVMITLTVNDETELEKLRQFKKEIELCAEIQDPPPEVPGPNDT